MISRLRLLAAISGACIVLAACGALQAATDASANAYRAVFGSNVTTLNVDVSASASINSDESGRPAPVVVRIYQLRDRKAFDSASLADLLTNDRALLGQDLAAELSAVLNPGASASLSQRMQPRTKYVAIVALYRNADTGGAWKRVIATKQLHADAVLGVTLDENRISLPDDVSGRGSASR
ncbi:type VI secretion system lipoprotein TssJ [Burkholderia pseudomultivorans]|uniref:type VI secretion system lipoprotein TssJ n=1 Tax=Burkholderia pseudomultivorans TaxID=1207504 RepID=UPI00287409D8|nr:type VI secretion system lipoprotein TssJ [Burkholderia pseudomultivorans]MDS0794251.1 type VI secretion system lipoprotein TssJ [Burkholderia pseudomultivorans]